MNVLFIGPDYMDLYKDIIKGFELLGYNVDFIPEMKRSEDPYYIAIQGNGKMLEANYQAQIRKEWLDILSLDAYNKKYDLLFVLDGMSIHPCLFEVLNNRNPQIYKVNYLFDTVRGVYRFDKLFPYFDTVATFDREESEKFNIDFFPIFWTKNAKDTIPNEQFILFGCGAYSKDRFVLYDYLKRYAEKRGYSSFLKLYIQKRKLFPFKSIIHFILGTPYLSFREYYSDMVIHSMIPPSKYRALLDSSKVVVDTSAPHQDGLTARFMWALGAGKKIITNNQSVKDYPFFTDAQILVVDPKDIDENVIDTFISSDYSVSLSTSSIISNYRIDNWLTHLLRK